MSADSSTSALIVGVDAGTSVYKAVAFDVQGRQLASASTPNTVLLGEGGRAEQEPDQTWASTCATLKALAAKVPGLAQRTLALAMTAQGDGTWLVDADGAAAGPAMLWLDGRAADEVATLRASAAAHELAQRTGTALNPSMQSVQLRWLMRQQDERLQRATSAMHCKDWLYFKATGKRVTCNAESVFTFGNYATGDYDEQVIELLGLGALRHLLPAIAEPGRDHAPLTRAAADACGLREGTPVVVAPMDVPATLLGSGAIDYGPDGQLRRVGCSVLGSTGMHGWAIEGAAKVRPSAEAGYTMAMPVPDVRARLMSHMAATLNIDWLIGLLGEAIALTGAAVPERAALLERLSQMVLSAAPAQALFHPYVADNGERGPFVDPQARAQLSGFGVGLGLAGLSRAVFEGIALATRDCYEALGPLPQEIRVSGGAARSPALRQLLANVTGCPVRAISREESGAAGAAMTATVAIGLNASVRDALPQWTHPYCDAQLTQPEPGEARLYDALFPIYRDTAASARPGWAALAALRRQQVRGKAAATARSPAP